MKNAENMIRTPNPKYYLVSTNTNKEKTINKHLPLSTLLIRTPSTPMPIPTQHNSLYSLYFSPRTL